jgi:hypothetical protein
MRFITVTLALAASVAAQIDTSNLPKCAVRRWSCTRHTGC